jgi:hypothetical protein
VICRTTHALVHNDNVVEPWSGTAEAVLSVLTKAGRSDPLTLADRDVSPLSTDSAYQWHNSDFRSRH